MDIGMLQLGVRQARFALPTAVVFSGVFTCQVLGMCPSQSEGSCSLVAFEQLGLDQVVSFTVPANLPSQAVMRSIGMQRDKDGDFLHPKLPDGHPLQPHVLYRIRRAQWEAQR